LVGVALFFPFVGPYAGIVAKTSGSLARQIANAHSIFNVAVSLVLFPFTGAIVGITKKLLPGRPQRHPLVTQFLDENLVKLPSIGLQEAAKELVRTGQLAGQMLTSAQMALLDMDEVAIDSVLTHEAQDIDPLCAEIERFVDRLLRGHLSEKQRRRCFQLKHLITDIERVADLTENLAQAGQERIRDDIPFSPQAQVELREFHSLVCEVWTLAVRALESGDKGMARAVVEGEDRIDQMERKLRAAHGQRLECGICTPKADILFIETLRNLERIGDHADNLGVSVLRN
jgi:phosphate:Na+ symporter